MKNLLLFSALALISISGFAQNKIATSKNGLPQSLEHPIPDVENKIKQNISDLASKFFSNEVVEKNSNGEVTSFNLDFYNSIIGLYFIKLETVDLLKQALFFFSTPNPDWSTQQTNQFKSMVVATVVHGIGKGPGLDSYKDSNKIEGLITFLDLYSRSNSIREDPAYKNIDDLLNNAKEFYSRIRKKMELGPLNQTLCLSLYDADTCSVPQYSSLK